MLMTGTSTSSSGVGCWTSTWCGYCLKEMICIVVVSMFSSYYYARTNRTGVRAFQSYERSGSGKSGFSPPMDTVLPVVIRLLYTIIHHLVSLTCCRTLEVL